MKKLLLVFVSILGLSCSPSVTDATVMITNLVGNSGGSGTIVGTNKDSSLILTNRHVCEVVKNGGLIHTDSGKYFVVGFKASSVHDLCLILIAENLHVSAKVSPTSPKPYTMATVSGHPHLMPTIITKGPFSQKGILQVMIGVRACTEAEALDPRTGPFCAATGQLPLVKSYEAIALSATIQPGSSGSAVYDETGRIAAVVFAGMGDLSYGYAVPLEYIHDFILYEAPMLSFSLVDNILRFVADSKESEAKSFYEKAKKVCDDSLNKDIIKDLCAQFTGLSKLSDMIERK